MHKTSAISPARQCAYRVIRRTFEQGAYADRALRGEAAGLRARDRALATALAFGTIQRRKTLDHVAARLSSRPPERLEPAVAAALALGLFQLLYLDGIAEHAAVHESVQLAKQGAGGGAGLVNAVLRRAAREGRQIIGGLGDATPAQAAVRHSVPVWLAERWFEELGAQRARSLLAAVNTPAEAALRVNTLRAEVARAAAALGVRSRPAGPELPEGLVVEEPLDVHGSEAFGRGELMPQSRASMLVARLLDPEPGRRLFDPEPGRRLFDPEPGRRVLDLCAAPGAKTTHLAALMGGRGELVAVERHPGRADALRRTCERMGAGNVRVVVADAERLTAGELGGPFERVLLDPPCSGLGTLQSRPDLRWRAAPERVAELAALQVRLLRVAASLTAPGGVLVYSVCTISAAEGEAVIEALARERDDFAAEDLQAIHPRWRSERVPCHLQLLPDRDGTDGFFIARLRRAG
jgi:16S rRNA (cytosine967-C5)-methyltransferase